MNFLIHGTKIELDEIKEKNIKINGNFVRSSSSLTRLTARFTNLIKLREKRDDARIFSNQFIFVVKFLRIYLHDSSIWFETKQLQKWLLNRVRVPYYVEIENDSFAVICTINHV